VDPWHARTVDETLENLEVQPDQGLTDDEAKTRYDEHGPNQLEEVKARPWWSILLAQLNSVIIYLLGGAAVLAFATQRWPEGGAVLAVLLVNTGIGFCTEWQAVRSMAALRKIDRHMTRVRRGGSERDMPATDLVPGDIVLLDTGDLAPADLRLVKAEHLRVNEAPLTGESVPANKLTDPVDEDAVLADRQNMLYKGTSVADGTAEGVVVATGQATELGRISELAASAEGTVTPLQQRLNSLGRRLAYFTIAIAMVVAVAGFLVRRQEAALVVETALALGIAAIPEGLPIVATIALARGMYLMAQRNALVNRLTAVETLGATRIIFSDKTGTLTENRMRLDRIVAPSGERSFGNGETAADDIDDMWLRRVLEVSVLCNGASFDKEEAGENDPAGDPTEVALLAGARKVGITREKLLEEYPEVRVEKFEPRTKKMATFHEDGDRIYVAVKGAADAILEVCRTIASAEENGDGELNDDIRREWNERANALAGKGLRVLAMADKYVDSSETKPYEGLRFLGLTGLLDPPRQRAKRAIDQCQAAGIRVKMVTGDQPETAKAIAEAVGIVGGEDDPETVVMHGSELTDPDETSEEHRKKVYRANIFARVSPEQKLNLVEVYQDRGEIVAMTGDGVNDAPALKKADIGIAMGKRGTEAAKQVADMVLQDDAFETIVAAVEQGRVIFGNIRKSVMFMLTTNVAEVIAVTVATLMGWTLPLRPLQILYLNVLTDVFPALALGVGPASGHEMERPPRDPKESVLTPSHWLEICGLATVFAACVLASLLVGERWLDLEPLDAVTLSFLTMCSATKSPPIRGYGARLQCASRCWQPPCTCRG